MAKDTRQALIEALEPIAAENGLDLVDLQLIGAHKSPTVQIFLDSANDSGITFDQIMDAHVWIDAYFEEEDPFPGAYTLEVSSPGIDRPLRRLSDYEAFAGETAVISMGQGQGKKRVKGVLAGVRDGLVLVDRGEQNLEIPFEEITRAHIQGQVDFTDGKER